jgi:HK97 gp10 family phage protein
MADGFIDIKLDKSFDEIPKRLRSLAPELARKILRRAVSAAVQEWAKDARRRALVGSVPHYVKLKGRRVKVDPGNLKRSIRVRQLRTEKFELSMEAASGLVVQSRAFYWRWIELGKRGFAARQFIKPAFDANVRQSFQTVAVAAAKFIEQHLRKR